MELSKVISSAFNTLKNRFLQVTRYGVSDNQTAREAMPYGVDSNPIAGMVAIFSNTTEKGKPVILGYINKNQIAKPGEFRVFSTDAAGNILCFMYFDESGTVTIARNDFDAVIGLGASEISLGAGTIIFNGQTNNLVKYNQLAAAFNQLRNDFNAHVHTVSGGGTSAPVTQSTANMSGAKAEDLYCDH